MLYDTPIADVFDYFRRCYAIDAARLMLFRYAARLYFHDATLRHTIFLPMFSPLRYFAAPMPFLRLR